MHSVDFPASTNLYNFWYAGEHIRRTHSVVLTESPLNVWRLEEAGILNAVALYGGARLTPSKMFQLDKLGVMQLMLAMDNDDAGREHAKAIKEAANRQYNIKEIILPSEANDIADLSVNQVKELFK